MQGNDEKTITYNIVKCVHAYNKISKKMFFFFIEQLSFCTALSFTNKKVFLDFVNKFVYLRLERIIKI